jgi:hypothetical protein
MANDQANSLTRLRTRTEMGEKSLSNDERSQVFAHKTRRQIDEPAGIPDNRGDSAGSKHQICPQELKGGFCLRGNHEVLITCVANSGPCTDAGYLKNGLCISQSESRPFY